MNPREPNPIITITTVLENVEVCDEHYRLRLNFPSFPESHPGQFLHIMPPVDDGLREQAASVITPGPALTFRRAFSIAGRTETAQGTVLDIVYRIVGKATAWMAELTTGQQVDTLGPVGNFFSIPSTNKYALLVSGGVGLPPMMYLAHELATAGVERVAICGAQRRQLLALSLDESVDFCTSGTRATLGAAEFEASGTSVVLASDDGSVGVTGFVTDALDAFLDAHPFAPDATIVYTCGPEVMMKKTAELCARRGLSCQVCMERSMACGMGTCQSCVVPIFESDGQVDWQYKLCCTHGPVFNANAVKWS